MIKIGDRQIGPGFKPYIIAEMSGNHNQSLDRALSIVEAAAEAGADAIKLQTYTADTMTLNVDHPQFFINDRRSLWHGKSLYELYEEAHTPWDWHRPIMNRANQLGMDFFSTPFDDTAVEFLESLDVPAYKVASFECVDIELIKSIASTGKPILLSTGMATIAEISDAVAAAKSVGNQNLIILKCTSSYPANAEDANLATLPVLEQIFDKGVGISDHTPGIGVAIAAVIQGANVVEKHFTLSRADGGVDSEFSMEPAEFKTLVEECNRAFHSIGKVQFRNSNAESGSIQFRRSLYFVSDLSAGDTVQAEDIKAIRPGFGLAPKHINNIVGKQLKSSVKKGTPVGWDILS